MYGSKVKKGKLSYGGRSVGQSILVSGHRLGPATSFSSPSMEIIFRQLGICYYGAVSLTRGQIYNLQLLLGLASAGFLGSQSRVTHAHILLSQF
jgi:hypothetical protein